MSGIVYQVPLAQLEPYRGRDLILRSEGPEALVDRLRATDIERLAYVQLRSLPDDTDCLIHWAEGLAVDLALNEPATDFPRLYRNAKLADNHPVRVSLPLVTGFDKAVKVAVSLGFSVKLEVGQPDPALIEPLARVLDAYLHQPTLSQPVEPFHSLLLGFCRDTPTSLWAIQE